MMDGDPADPKMLIIFGVIFLIGFLAGFSRWANSDTDMNYIAYSVQTGLNYSISAMFLMVPIVIFLVVFNIDIY